MPRSWRLASRWRPLWQAMESFCLEGTATADTMEEASDPCTLLSLVTLAGKGSRA